MVRLACFSQNMFSPHCPVSLHIESQPCREGTSHPAVCCGQWRPHGHLQRKEVVLVSTFDPWGLRGDRHTSRGQGLRAYLVGTHAVLNKLQLSCQPVLWFQQLCSGEATHLHWFLGHTLKVNSGFPSPQMVHTTDRYLLRLCGLRQAISPFCGRGIKSQQSRFKGLSLLFSKPTPKIQSSAQHSTL